MLSDWIDDWKATSHEGFSFAGKCASSFSDAKRAREGESRESPEGVLGVRLRQGYMKLVEGRHEAEHHGIGVADQITGRTVASPVGSTCRG